MKKLEKPNVEVSAKIELAGIVFSGTISKDKITATWDNSNKKTGIYFADIPLIENIADNDDGIFINSLGFTYAGNLEFLFDAELKIRQNSISINSEMLLNGAESPALPDNGNGKPPGETSDVAVYNGETPLSAPSAGAGDITWVELNKSVAGLNLKKVGFSMKGGVKLYLQASLNISVLELELCEFCATLPIGGNKFSVGLKGMTVGINAPMLSVSGGLYMTETADGKIFNGALSLTFKNLTLSALGSYAKINGSPSFFLYAFLGYPIGGPAFFYVTGLALGFGVNRAIKMPEVEKISEFPLVKAVTSPSKSKLSAPAGAGNAPEELSDWIYPSDGSYFAAAGVKFTSFAVLESFALLIIEFGSRFRATLLGQSVLSMPMNSSNPILYVKLLLRAFYDADTGYIEVRAALTNDSYFLSKKCRLQGGMAACVWTKGERAGDFMIMIGGCHHPLFKDKNKYPSVDKVGINWRISNNLTLKGLGYFAVTHSCAMGGVDISVDYAAGNLSAWFRASAHFFVKWKPLFYDVDVSIRVGASYRMKLLFVKVTISVELGARLHLWGPEFAGTATLNCYVFSVQISFGPRRTAPPKLNWDDFYASFLPQNIKPKCGQTYLNEKYKLASLSVTDGIIREYEDTLLVKPSSLAFTINTPTPCTEFVCDVCGERFENTYAGQYGIIPMNAGGFSGELSVEIYRVGGKSSINKDCVTVSAVYGNLSSAVWGNKFDQNNRLIKNAVAGIDFRFDDTKQIQNIRGPYMFSDLVRHNDKSFAWKDTPPKSERREKKFYECNFCDIRKDNQKIISELSNLFGTYNGVRINGDLKSSPSDYFWEEPSIGRIAELRF